MGHVFCFVTYPHEIVFLASHVVALWDAKRQSPLLLDRSYYIWIKLCVVAFLNPIPFLFKDVVDDSFFVFLEEFDELVIIRGPDFYHHLWRGPDIILQFNFFVVFFIDVGNQDVPVGLKDFAERSTFDVNHVE